MATYTQEDTLLAWKTFIASGVILKDKVRPIVARSWEHCRESGLDPWSSSFPKCSNSFLTKKRTQYAELLSIASPVMNYVCTLLNNNISICDAEGFCFELVTPLKYYPRTLGTYVKEETCGNGAVTISLNERIPSRVDGYEHYRIISHHHSNVSSPYFKGDTFMGVLNAVSPFGDLPEKALQLIISAAKIIELHLENDQKRYDTLETIKLFKEMIGCCSQGVVILEKDGTILAANQACKQLLSYTNHDDLISKSFTSYLASANDLSKLMSCKAELLDKPTFALKRPLSNKEDTLLECILIRKNHIKMINGDIHTLLMIDKYGTNDTENTYTTIPFAFTPDKNPLINPAISVNVKNPKTEEVEYIGESPAWSKVHEMVIKTASFPSNVLLQGESGTGKEIVALTIHRLSKRKGNFVAINCGAIPKELLYSELFGYEKGAFTGAHVGGSIGKFEYADEGTLFLDEIGEMPLDMQVSLLRFIQEMTITRIGSNKSKKVNVRIIAATNKDLTELIRAGRFREDLYYRLNVIDIKLPPLRERKSDIPMLANYFVSKFAEQFGTQQPPLSEKVLQILYQYNWPGNVRELKNVMEKALILSGGKDITPKCLTDRILTFTPDPDHSKDNGSHDAKRELLELLERNNYNISKVAKAMNITRNTLYRKIEKYNIKLKTSVSSDIE